MFRPSACENNRSQVTTPDLDDSITFSDDVNPDVVDVDVDVDVDSMATKKPHFLDYDAAPPPDFIEHFDRAMNFSNPADRPSTTNGGCISAIAIAGSGEQLKLDKMFEKDGEISDYELAASGYTKKEFTQDDNTLNINSVVPEKSRKHFLDENPIPPDYMLSEHQLREHRSLDRNFERHAEQRSAIDLHAVNLPGYRSSRERFKEANASFSKLPKGSAWTQSFDSRYDSNQETDKLDNFGPKVECVYSLLSMLGSNDPLEMSKKFHELSKTPETCHTLRRSGCIPLLVQIVHAEVGPDEPRKWAGMALHNVVHCHPDEKCGRREAKVLRLLDQIMDYCNFLRTLLQSGGEAIADDADRHPLAAMSSLMKVSFDEEHRHAMCDLGALQGIPSLVHLDHAVHGPKPENQCCNSLRRFALMALTNLTFGDENNKALLCSQKLFMEALVAQLDSAPDDLLQVTASVLRNLSWRADAQMKSVLNEIGTVTALAKAAMKNKCENTLKAILSALWNLSAHCSTNKAEFCAVDGALSFIVCMLTYEGPSKTLKIIENAGGILRNVSSHIAVREEYRQILREHNCLSILLQQLKSESLTVVSNSCGTLWNLSARCPEDQRFLWDNGAVPMLRSLIHSKHAMISEGSACALKNLLNFRPSSQNTNQLDPIARSLNLKKLPTLNVRKQKALEQELGAAAKKHSETCDNLDTGNPKDRPTYDATAAVSGASALQRHRFPLHAGALGSLVLGGASSSGRLTRSAMLTKSESRDSVFSAKSDGVVYDQLMRSQSASDANRKLNHIPKATSSKPSYPLEGDVEPAEEQPIDYSQKYTEHISKHQHPREDTVGGTVTYQETDLDQPTDFSLRYAENQLELEASEITRITGNPGNDNINISENIKLSTESHGAARPANQPDGNEILLILDDTVKCYQTEDTPYVISNAASVTDLRSVPTSVKTEETVESSEIPLSSSAAPLPSRKLNRSHQPHHQQSSHLYGSGSYTPEKPVNYCEEGTPGYFSRYESLSSLDESPPQAEPSAKEVQKEKAVPKPEELTCVEKSNTVAEKLDSQADVSVAQPQVNSALETPLMFSRRSSMDSLAEEDVGPIDDKSSVVSEFSRLASGVISPSEIPDSPTQSMPQSPRRNSSSGTAPVQCFSDSVSPNTRKVQNREGETRKRCLRSVFEDDLNTFHEENTPAQFSTATSLSNLSILDEDVSSTNHSPPQPQRTAATTNTISEGEEEEDGIPNTNDDLLLASCINMGMNRSAVPTMYSQNTDNNSTASHCVNMPHDEPKQYYTEDTPALMSKVGSNTNLSAISLCSSTNDPKDDTVFEAARSSLARTGHHNQQTVNRRSLNLSDDMSSNASESGAAGIDILQQCIRDGMQKTSTKDKTSSGMANHMDPIAMLRRGGNILPPYIPGNDEMNKYRVEDSPCNFSVMSGLSNLTVGSSIVGPATLMSGTKNTTPNKVERSSSNNMRLVHSSSTLIAVQDEKPLIKSNIDEGRRAETQWQDDSLSSLSIESEDDTNLLSQAIAAGCNRPKSNLGFTTNLTSTGKHTTNSSLSSSQQMPINAAASASSLTSQATTRAFDKQHEANPNSQQKEHFGQIQAGNESYSSVDSSDSNDNQSKSLFELCILTGMHKNRDNQLAGGSSSSSSRKHTRSANSHRSHKSSHIEHNTTQSNPNLKQFDSLPLQGKQLTPNRHVRDRDRRDEKLLMECINTGIMKKIGEISNKPPSSQHGSSPLTREALILHNNQPKNGQATSAAAQMEELVRPQSAKYMDQSSPASTITAKSSTTIITAAPDVEKKDNSMPNYHIPVPETLNQRSRLQNTITTTTTTNHVDGTRDQKNHFSLNILEESPAVLQDENHPNQGNAQEIMNATGYKTDELGTGQSDESNQSFIMETTVTLESKPNEPAGFPIKTNEKHKDPDLMLKSVERLTMEFVSSAEQLRINSSSTLGVTQSISNEASVECTTNSISNDTWDEDTCPNDVSFPSVSISAPKVNSISFDDDDDQGTTADYKELNDFTENTPINDELPAPDMSLDFDNLCNGFGSETSQPSSLDFTDTDKTLRHVETQSESECNLNNGQDNGNGGLHFKLGGIVQTAAATPSLFFSMSSMTNSTFIAQEARKLANTLQSRETDGEEDELTFSVNSVDLDNIRPPSGMDSLNISGYYQESTQPNSLQSSPHSPQMFFKSPKFPRKTLPAGLVARRALGHMPPHLTGSVESLNSSCNLMLDNIKPPSLMDELLDSMISVASIQSEVADDCPSMATTVTVSNYETATAGVGDGDTITLHSCSDEILPRDDDCTINDGSVTPLPFDCDFSSAESTPKKSGPGSPCSANKRTLTPKQKRQEVKDRYRTYTIDAKAETSGEVMRRIEDDENHEDETLAIEITTYETMTIHTDEGGDEIKPENEQQNTPRNRRRSSQDRYRTQTIKYSDLQANLPTHKHESEITTIGESCCYIKNISNNFKIINNLVCETTTTTTLPVVDTKTDQEQKSLECDQNSETESCHNFESNARYLTDCEEEQELEEAEAEGELELKHGTDRPRIIKPSENGGTIDFNSNLPEIEQEQEHFAAVKAIRGGKKPQYVSPYSIKYQKTHEIPRQPISKLQSCATKSNLMKKHNGVAVVTGSEAKMAAQKKTMKDATRPQDGAACSTATAAELPQIAPLERQGTFVKDEPSLDSSAVPVVETSPTKSRTSKLPMKRQTSYTMSPQKTANTRKLPTSATIANTSKRCTGGSISKPQRANSNVNIRVTTNAARIAVLSSRVSTTTPPSRSNSSLNSSNAAVTAAQNAAAKINQARSRIAGIWRKVDEVKGKQQNIKTTNKGSQLGGKSTNKNNVNAATQPPGKLVRSTTFDNSPPIAVVARPHTKATTTVNGTAKVPAAKISVAQRQILTSRK